MNTISIISGVLKAIICGFLPLAIIILSLVLVFYKRKTFSFDTERMGEQFGVMILNVLYIIILWFAAITLFNQSLYEQILTTASKIVTESTNVIINGIVEFVLGLGVVIYIFCQLFIKITVYPDLAFRVYKNPENIKDEKEYLQVVAQFWNAGILTHHNLKVQLLKWSRGENNGLVSMEIPVEVADGDAYIRNVFYSQDERAYNWKSLIKKWEKTNESVDFEYLELSISSEVRILNTGKSFDFYDTKRFYPLDIHQGDFNDLNNKKEVPQYLLTSFNNGKKYISAKRKIQICDEWLRLIQCVLFILYILVVISAMVISQNEINLALDLVERSTMALFLIITACRIILNIPIKANETPSYLYGDQQE